jgi:hypothetical protein
MSPSPPLMCTLSDAEKREREATLLAEFKSVVTAIEELNDGYDFRTPGHEEHLALVTKLIAAERECCPFLTFQLFTEPQMGPLTLRITGPEGAKALVKCTFAS